MGDRVSEGRLAVLYEEACVSIGYMGQPASEAEDLAVDLYNARAEVARLRALLAEARTELSHAMRAIVDVHNCSSCVTSSGEHQQGCRYAATLAKLDAELGVAAGENEGGPSHVDGLGLPAREASEPVSGVGGGAPAPAHAAPDHAEPVTEFTDEQLVRELNRRLVPCREGHRAELLCLWPCWRCKVAEELAKAGDLRYVTVSEDSLLRLAEIAVQESDEDNETSSSAVVAARALERWRREREGRC